MNATRPVWWFVKIVLSNGFVSSGNKPLPKPMLTQMTRDITNAIFIVRRLQEKFHATNVTLWVVFVNL